MRVYFGWHLKMHHYLETERSMMAMHRKEQNPYVKDPACVRAFGEGINTQALSRGHTLHPSESFHRLETKSECSSIFTFNPPPNLDHLPPPSHFKLHKTTFFRLIFRPASHPTWNIISA